MDAAIGDDLDIAISEEQVHEHARVFLGIPHAQEAEYLERALARRQPLQHPRRGSDASIATQTCPRCVRSPVAIAVSMRSSAARGKARRTATWSVAT
jgi:hypothetical protein